MAAAAQAPAAVAAGRGRRQSAAIAAREGVSAAQLGRLAWELEAWTALDESEDPAVLGAVDDVEEEEEEEEGAEVLMAAQAGTPGFRLDIGAAMGPPGADCLAQRCLESCALGLGEADASVKRLGGLAGRAGAAQAALAAASWGVHFEGYEGAAPGATLGPALGVGLGGGGAVGGGGEVDSKALFRALASGGGAGKGKSPKGKSPKRSTK